MNFTEFLSLFEKYFSLPAYFHNLYFQSFLIILVSALGGWLFLFGVLKTIERWASRTQTTLDDLVISHFKYPLFFLIVTYGLKTALLHLGIDGLISKIANSLMALVFLWILLRTVDLVIEIWSTHFAPKTKSLMDDILLPLLHRITKILFLFIGLLWVLHLWGVDITPYLAGMGISGIVLGLALQDSLKNIFGGISLIVDKTFVVGEAIKLESGEVGRVQEIGLRSTKILTSDHELIFIPNGQLANMRINNLMKPNSRVRRRVEFHIAYGTDVLKLRKLIVKVLAKIGSIHQEPPPQLWLEEMADSGLKCQARFWVDWEKANDTVLEVTEAVYAALENAKIEIPYPTRTVYMKKRK